MYLLYILLYAMECFSIFLCCHHTYVIISDSERQDWNGDKEQDGKNCRWVQGTGSNVWNSTQSIARRAIREVRVVHADTLRKDPC
jgi:hypothetical protein